MTPSLGRRASYGPISPVVGARGERTREAVLDAAVEAFQSKGLPDTSVDEIAETAGVCAEWARIQDKYKTLALDPAS